MATRTTQYNITGDASRFAEAMEKASVSAEEMEGSLTSLEDHLSSVTGETLQYDQAASRFRDASGQFVSGAEAQERALTNLRGQLEATERTQRQMSSSMSRVGASASSTATNLGFELVQGAQDAKFGMAGLANQIPLMSEQFSRLKQQTGSTRGALGALASTFLSPGTGVIAAITLLLTFKDDILGFFSDAEESADEAKKAMQEAADAITEFERFSVAGVPISPATITPAIRGLREQLQSVRLERRLIQEQMTELTADGTPRGAAAAKVQQLQLQSLRQQKKELQDQEAFFDDRLQALIKQRKQYNRQLDLQNLLEEATGQTARAQQEIADSAEDAADEAERYVSAFQGPDIFQISENLEQVRGFIRRRRQGTPARGGMGPRFGLPSSAQMQQQIFGMQQQAAAFGGARANARALGGARQAAANLGLIEPFKDFDEVVGGTDEINFGLENAIRLASQLGTTMAQAAQQGQVEWNQLLGTILTAVGSAVGTVNPAAGAAISGTGQILGSFQHGGTAPGGLIRAHPPEVIANPPKGAQIISQERTLEALGGGASKEEIQKLRADVQTLTRVLERKPTGITRREAYDAIVIEDINRAEDNGTARLQNPELGA